jgi:hypothetical protein
LTAKRGRPANLTAEEKLQRQKERWRREKARQRKETAESQWLRTTDFGYFDDVEVFHCKQFVEYLVYAGFLDEIDAENKTMIHEAADDLLLAYVEDRTHDYGLSHRSSYHGCYGPNPNFRGRSDDGVGKVRIKITMRLVEALGLESDRDKQWKIRKTFEELLFNIYSNLADRSLPDPWPKGGEVCIFR